MIAPYRKAGSLAALVAALAISGVETDSDLRTRTDPVSFALQNVEGETESHATSSFTPDGVAASLVTSSERQGDRKGMTALEKSLARHTKARPAGVGALPRPDIGTMRQPFPVSPSVETDCREIARSGAIWCDDADKALTRFAAEPRDAVWAAAMEKQLRAQVARDEVGKHWIRALECRTSLCMIEVESTIGPYLGHSIDAASTKRQLSVPAFGYERAEDGSQITVTLLAYSRY